MINEKILSFISKIEFKAKKLLSGCLSGDYKSRLRGFGYDFDQLTEYQIGDDIRYIDWKGSAKTNQLLIRKYLDDKNRNVYIVVDISASVFYGSNDKLKIEIIYELASLLSFIFLYSKDSVGLILFDQDIELFIKAKSSRAHIINLINQLLSFKPKNKKTDINNTLKFLSKLKIKNSIVFLISDLISHIDKNILRLTAQKHDLIVFRCLDDKEIHFPYVGIFKFQDIETGQTFCLNTKNSEFNEKINSWLKNQDKLLRQAKVDFLNVSSNLNFEKELIGFLQNRVKS